MVEPPSQKELSHSIDMILGRGGGSGAGAPRDRDAQETRTAGEGVRSSQVLLGRHRRIRTTFSAEQLQELENAFQASRYPSVHTREQLASHTHLSETKIQIWFQNRRAKWRRSESGTSLYPCGLHGSEPDTPTYAPPPLPPHWLLPTNHLLDQRTAFLAVGPRYPPVSSHLGPLALGSRTLLEHFPRADPWLRHGSGSLAPLGVWVSGGPRPLHGHIECV